MENNTESTTNETTTTATAEATAKKERQAPAYLAFVEGLQTKAEALGLSIKEQKGYVQFKNLTTGHRMVVAKQGKAVTRIDTTLEVLGQEGTRELDAPNGRITCHIDPNPDTVAHYLAMLAESGEKLRAPKREKKVAAPAAEEPTQASA